MCGVCRLQSTGCASLTCLTQLLQLASWSLSAGHHHTALHSPVPTLLEAGSTLLTK
jgi:hypothetical protein